MCVGVFFIHERREFLSGGGEMGLRQVGTRVFFIFCQILDIFDDFSKWNMSIAEGSAKL